MLFQRASGTQFEQLTAAQTEQKERTLELSPGPTGLVQGFCVIALNVVAVQDGPWRFSTVYRTA